MDFILEEEMIDTLTFCLQNPNSDLIESKKLRFKEIGQEVKFIRIQHHFDYYGMVFLMSGTISRENL